MAIQGAAIEIHRLTHRYRDGREALRELDLSILRGVLFGLLGPNGSGKTTLFRILSTLIAPTDGTVRILGLKLGRESAAIRREIGVTFQSPSVDKKLTVRENLECHGALYGLGGAPLRDRIEELLALFSLVDRREDRVERLSGGLARRVEIAKALLHRPAILLMDEPSTGLDPTARRGLSNDLTRLVREKGVTCVLTTHFLDEAEGCDEIALLNDGRRVADGSPQAMKESVGKVRLTLSTSQPEKVAAWLREQGASEVVRTDAQVVVVTDQGAALASRLFAELGSFIQSADFGPPTLETVFEALTGKVFYERDEP